MLIDSITLSGGGYRGYIHLGALNVLFQEIDFSQVKILAGTSVGSLVCLLSLLDCKPSEIMRVLSGNDNLKSQGMSLSGAVDKLGLLDTVCLEEKLLEFVPAEKLYVTFETLLAQTNQHFICCAVNIDENTAEYFSPETTPGLRCVDAVLASCCLPGIFQVKTIGGKKYVDGGLADNFPKKYATEYKSRLFPGASGIDFGVVISTTIKGEVESLPDYIFRIINIPVHIRNAEHKGSPNVLFVEDEQQRDKYELFELGTRECVKYLVNL